MGSGVLDDTSYSIMNIIEITSPVVLVFALFLSNSFIRQQIPKNSTILI